MYKEKVYYVMFSGGCQNESASAALAGAARSTDHHPPVPSTTRYTQPFQPQNLSFNSSNDTRSKRIEKEKDAEAGRAAKEGSGRGLNPGPRALFVTYNLE